MKRCFLYCAGEYCEGYIYPQSGDAVAAIDGGFLLTEKLGLSPDVVIGDFDSLGKVPEDVEVMKYPGEKDDTDTAIACEHFIKKGYDRFYFLGATGGRPEHTYANIQLLHRLALRGAHGYIFAHDCVFTAIRNEAIAFDDSYSGYISVFALSDRAEGVSIDGLKYSLDNAELSSDRPLGVSNEFISKSASVSVKDGTLLIIFERKGALMLPETAE